MITRRSIKRERGRRKMDIVGLNGQALTAETQFRAAQTAGFEALKRILESDTTSDAVRLQAAVFAITLSPGR